MKTGMFFLSLTLILVFGLSIRNSVISFGLLKDVPSLEEGRLVGFDPELSNNREFNELQRKISAMITRQKNAANRYSGWGVTLNLLITVATGISALITTVSTIKNNGVSKTTAIQVAVITFISTMLSFSMSQVNTFREEAEGKRAKILEIRNQLESLKPEELKSQLPRINRQLDEDI